MLHNGPHIKDTVRLYEQISILDTRQQVCVHSDTVGFEKEVAHVFLLFSNKIFVHSIYTIHRRTQFIFLFGDYVRLF
jgi:hypothetical protein